MTPLVVDQHTARNPVARAIAKRTFVDSVRGFQLRLYLLDEGEDCESDAIAAMQVMAVAMEGLRITGRDRTPDAQVIRGGMSCLVQIAGRGFKWRPDDAGAIDAAISRARDAWIALKAKDSRAAYLNVRNTERRIELEAA